MHHYLWTTSGARLQLMHSQEGKPYHWLFLPGGPGLGSESLLPLVNLLSLPGSMWLLDLPGDGSNVMPDNRQSFSQWSQALVEAIDSLSHVILVAHSTGGMYALATPLLKNKLAGLVLMHSAPSAEWQNAFAQYVKQHPLPEVESLHEAYLNNPTNDLLKKITVASAPYLFATPAGLKAGILLLENLPYNKDSCAWSAQHFDQTYEAKWIPDNIPTLIFSGVDDYITPLFFFAKSNSFHQQNILLREIPNAGHFAWLEQPEAVKELFKEYGLLLSNQKK